MSKELSVDVSGAVWHQDPDDGCWRFCEIEADRNMNEALDNLRDSRARIVELEVERDDAKRWAAFALVARNPAQRIIEREVFLQVTLDNAQALPRQLPNVTHDRPQRPKTEFQRARNAHKQP